MVAGREEALTSGGFAAYNLRLGRFPLSLADDVGHRIRCPFLGGIIPGLRIARCQFGFVPFDHAGIQWPDHLC